MGPTPSSPKGADTGRPSSQRNGAEVEASGSPSGPGLSAPEQLQLTQEAKLLLLHVPGDCDHVPVDGDGMSAEDQGAGLGREGSGPASRAPLHLLVASLRLALQPTEPLLCPLQLRAQRLECAPQLRVLGFCLLLFCGPGLQLLLQLKIASVLVRGPNAAPAPRLGYNDARPGKWGDKSRSPPAAAAPRAPTPARSSAAPALGGPSAPRGAGSGVHEALQPRRPTEETAKAE